MKHLDLLKEANDCRRKALTYVGQPEATFLLRVPKAFEALEADKLGAQ